MIAKKRTLKPWHNCPRCPECKLQLGEAVSVSLLHLRCFGCGHRWIGTKAEVNKAVAATLAWDAEEDRLAAQAKEKAAAADLERKFRLAKEGKWW